MRLINSLKGRWRMRLLLSWCCAVVITIMTVFTAHAFKVGDYEIRMRSSVFATYDDNITYVNRNALHDFITDLGFGFDILREKKRQTFAFSGDVGYEMFDKYHKFTNFNQNANLKFIQEFSKDDRITVTDNYSHQSSPTGFEDEFERVPGKYSYHTNAFRLSYSRDFSKILLMRLTYLNDRTYYSRKDLTDSYANGAALNLEYAFKSWLSFLASANYSRREYERNGSVATNSYLGGVRYYFLRTRYVDALGGYDFIESADGAKEKNPTWQVLFTEEIDPQTVAHVRYTTNFSSSASNQDVLDSWRVSADLIRELLKRLSVNFNCFYGEGNYTGQAITDKLRGARIGFNYDLKENIKLSIAYNYSDLSSNIATREYTKNTISLGMRVDF